MPFMPSRPACLIKGSVLMLVFLAAAFNPEPAATAPEVDGQEKPAAKKSAVPARPLTYWQWLRQCPPRVPEIVEMVWALATGGDLEGGVGWFHPGQSRYGWDWLAARYDTD